MCPLESFGYPNFTRSTTVLPQSNQDRELKPDPDLNKTGYWLNPNSNCTHLQKGIDDLSQRNNQEQ